MAWISYDYVVYKDKTKENNELSFFVEIVPFDGEKRPNFIQKLIDNVIKMIQQSKALTSTTSYSKIISEKVKISNIEDTNKFLYAMCKLYELPKVKDTLNKVRHIIENF